MRQGFSGVSVAMETGRRELQSAESGSYAFAGATWTPTQRLARIRSPSQCTWLSSIAYSESFHHDFGARPVRIPPLELPPLSEPHLLRLRPTSLRTQDISYLLTGVFRNLYTSEVIGEEVSANLIKARGSEDARHEEFVDQLQQVTQPCVSRASSACSPGAGRLCFCSRAGAPRARISHSTSVSPCQVPGAVQALGMQPGKSRPSPWCNVSDILVEGHYARP